MNARTTHLKLLSASTMALLVTMVAGYLMSERASAQRIPSPGDPVLAAVQDVQRTIGGLQVDVNALQVSVDAQLALGDNHFRWTPAAFASADLVTCKVVNVSDVPKTIHIELKTREGATQLETMVEPAPGASSSVGAGQPLNGSFHCKFTVFNGTRADIRGTIVGRNFQIPAE